jgi:ribulose-5-phosphate 4-epimerase/fuculose-1-phosphate aldolase
MKEGQKRFKSIFVSEEVPIDQRIEELKQWCGEFQKNKLTPEVEGNYTGNLSFRFKDGFVITISGLKSKENLTADCFVYVKSSQEQSSTFYVEGKKQPSSESIMHSLIYRNSSNVNAVFHGHNDTIVAYAKELGLHVTKREYEPGTIELAKEVLKILGKNKVIVLRNHGFISIGRNMREAGKQALVTLNRSKVVNMLLYRN